MTPHEILIAYMRAKAKLLPCYQEEYFTEKDAAAIRAWKAPTARRVLKFLRHSLPLVLTQVPGEEFMEINDGETCVFCIRHFYKVPKQWQLLGDMQGCAECEYGEEHGICSAVAGNIYDRIFEELPEEADGINGVIAPHIPDLLKIVQEEPK